jgi:hypothetical protein
MLSQHKNSNKSKWIILTAERRTEDEWCSVLTAALPAYCSVDKRAQHQQQGLHYWIPSPWCFHSDVALHQCPPYRRLGVPSRARIQASTPPSRVLLCSGMGAELGAAAALLSLDQRNSWRFRKAEYAYFPWGDFSRVRSTFHIPHSPEGLSSESLFPSINAARMGPPLQTQCSLFLHNYESRRVQFISDPEKTHEKKGCCISNHLAIETSSTKASS